MADEWSKPVKDGVAWVTREGGDCYPQEAELGPDGNIVIGAQMGHDAGAAPRDVVLRLLAAEASDRLGWVWEVERFEPRFHPRPDHRRTLLHARVTLSSGATEVLWWAEWDGDRVIRQAGFEEVVPDTPDELLAAMHGRLLLEDALREAGR